MATGTIKKPAWAYEAKRTIGYGSRSYVDYVKFGNIVQVWVSYWVSDGAISAWTNKDIVTIPSGYRPAVDIVQAAVTDRITSAGSSISILPSGVVRITARYNDISNTEDRITALLTYGTTD